MTFRRPALPLAAVLLAAAALPASAQTLDGSYVGRIRCGAIPASALGAFAQDMTLTVAQASVSGQRVLGRSGQVGGTSEVERWSGASAADGTLALESNWRSPRGSTIQGKFAGKIVNNQMTFSGTQQFREPGVGSASSRDCSFSGTRR